MQGTWVEELCHSPASYAPEESTHDATSRKRKASSDSNIDPEPQTKRLRVSSKSSHSSFPGNTRSSTIDDDSDPVTPFGADSGEEEDEVEEEQEEEEEEEDDDEDRPCPTCYSVGTFREEGCVFCTTCGTVLVNQRSPLVQDNVFYEGVTSVEGWLNRAAREVLADLEEDEEQEDVGTPGSQDQAHAFSHAPEVLRAEAALLQAEARSKEAMTDVIEARLRLQALKRA